MKPLETLVSMTDFVFHLRNMTTSELCKTYPKNFKTPVWNGNQSDMVKDMLAIDAIQWKLTGEYAKFLRQPLTLGMFVPCDEVGEVLEEPYNDGQNDMYYGAALDAYNKAKSRCLFEGFEIEQHEEESYSIRCENNILNVMWKFPNEEWRPAKGVNTIEDLTIYGLTLTPYAKELIYKH